MSGRRGEDAEGLGHVLEGRTERLQQVTCRQQPAFGGKRDVHRRRRGRAPMEPPWDTLTWKHVSVVAATWEEAWAAGHTAVQPRPRSDGEVGVLSQRPRRFLWPGLRVPRGTVGGRRGPRTKPRRNIVSIYVAYSGSVHAALSKE